MCKVTVTNFTCLSSASRYCIVLLVINDLPDCTSHIVKMQLQPQLQAQYLARYILQELMSSWLIIFEVEVEVVFLIEMSDVFPL